MIHIYCGDGKGKTTAATGLAVRAIGSGRNVLFVQFFKNGSSSEIKMLKTFKNLTYMKTEHSFGRFANMSDEEKSIAFEHFNNLVIDAINCSVDYNMVVFDEIISTYNLNFLDKEHFLNFCIQNQDKEIVLTGRNPSEELLKIADYVSEIKKIKHPFDNGTKARYGIEF
ncbi:MAG: cob(I)yrinic acid a,c-diamide adenosyltransferase [Clostridia bacterium]